MSEKEKSQQNRQKKKKKKQNFKLFSVLDKNEKHLQMDASEAGIIQMMTETCKDFFDDTKLIVKLIHMSNHELYSAQKTKHDSYKKIYDHLEGLVSDYKFGIREVEKFVNEKGIEIMEDNYNSGNLFGAYMSVLMNKGYENEKKAMGNKKHFRNICLEMSLLPREFSLLGYGLKEDMMLTINGNAGHNCGFFLDGGRIEIIGNTGYRCGDSAISGHIEVYGDTGAYLAKHMEGGYIVVHGNTGEWVGNNMEGGHIKVEKNVKSIGSSFRGGTIIVDGKIDMISRFLPDAYGKREVWKKSNIFNKYRRMLPKGYTYKTYDEILK